MDMLYFTIGVLSVLVVLLTVLVIIGFKSLLKLKNDFRIQVNIDDRRFDNLYNEKNKDVDEIYRFVNDQVSDLQRQINR